MKNISQILVVVVILVGAAAIGYQLLKSTKRKADNALTSNHAYWTLYQQHDCLAKRTNAKNCTEEVYKDKVKVVKEPGGNRSFRITNKRGLVIEAELDKAGKILKATCNKNTTRCKDGKLYYHFTEKTRPFVL